jgi:hypothetical protein
MKAFLVSAGIFTLVIFSALLLLITSGCTQPPPPAADQSSVPNPQAAPPPGGTTTASAPSLPVANYSTESRIRRLNCSETQVDGFLLDNGVQVPFPPSFSGTVPPLRTRVRVSGFLHPADANGRTVVEAHLSSSGRVRDSSRPSVLSPQRFLPLPHDLTRQQGLRHLCRRADMQLRLLHHVQAHEQGMRLRHQADRHAHQRFEGGATQHATKANQD